ncbi:MAG: hypothetical protein JF887_06805 [Candidatus Dormibacteraeota bacterium]|uniref:Uncharacterized protein n=1 Tax=Candidatus Amunia macphersoniae TaxID=3127014 RepID=A0A934NGC0_9BACT|nr:hypothetical protein [Candidatus Dormibacteraeota bacterium]
MKFSTAPAFDGDWRRLSAGEQALFRTALHDHFIPACDARAQDPIRPWPRGLRVKSLKGAAGIMEMTWSFSGPDGRATFEWRTIDGQPMIRWRRVGGHDIFDKP